MKLKSKQSLKKIKLPSGAIKSEAGRPALSSSILIKLSNFSPTNLLLNDGKQEAPAVIRTPRTATSKVDLMVETGQRPSEISTEIVSKSFFQKQDFTRISWERNSPGHFIKVHSSRYSINCPKAPAATVTCSRRKTNRQSKNLKCKNWEKVHTYGCSRLEDNSGGTCC